MILISSFYFGIYIHSQVFSIYESLPDPSLHRMNEVVKKAVYLCTAFYFSVGCFGYIAFSTEGISGNILMSFGPAWTTQIIKACFVLSIVFSVPLCVFPCRASLYSLLYKGVGVELFRWNLEKVCNLSFYYCYRGTTVSMIFRVTTFQMGNSDF